MTEVQRARKKPVEIEFMRFDGTPASGAAIMDWACAALDPGPIPERGEGWTCPVSYTYDEDGSDCAVWITTLEGVMRGDLGDYVIRGVQGEFYPCKPDIFEQTYDIVEA
jgi:hypothetical protein